MTTYKGQIVELVPSDERGDADAVLQVPINGGQTLWEFDVNCAALGVIPELWECYDVDILQDGPKMTVTKMTDTGLWGAQVGIVESQ